MNRKIVALSLYVLPFVFYVLQYHDIAPTSLMWLSIFAALLFTLWIRLPMNRNDPD